MAGYKCCYCILKPIELLKVIENKIIRFLGFKTSKHKGSSDCLLVCGLHSENVVTNSFNLQEDQPSTRHPVSIKKLH